MNNEDLEKIIDETIDRMFLIADTLNVWNDKIVDDIIVDDMIKKIRNVFEDALGRREEHERY